MGWLEDLKQQNANEHLANKVVVYSQQNHQFYANISELQAWQWSTAEKAAADLNAWLKSGEIAMDTDVVGDPIAVQGGSEQSRSSLVDEGISLKTKNTLLYIGVFSGIVVTGLGVIGYTISKIKQ